MFGRILLLPFRPIKTEFSRNLLSNAFKATTLWEERLQHPVFKVATANDLSILLAQRLTTNNVVPFLDYDVLMNRIHQLNLTNLEYVESFIKTYNLTQESTKRWPMTSHGFIRGYIDLHAPYRLLSILDDPIKFGIFLDPVSSLLLMDTFVEQGEFQSAAKVVWLWTRQEEAPNPLLTLLALHSCSNFWHSKEWKPKTDDSAKVEEEPQGDPEYVFVKYVRNEHYDDHFDIVESRLWLGKTFVHLGWALNTLSHKSVASQPLAWSCQLLGLALYEKFDQLLALAKQVHQATPPVAIPSDLHEHILELISSASQLPEGESRKPGEVPRHSAAELQAIESEFRALTFPQSSESLHALCHNHVSRHFSVCEQASLPLVQQLYTEFMKTRKETIENLLKERERQAVIRESKATLRSLVDKEELLTYTENRTEIRFNAWLAPRTTSERRTRKKDIWARDLANLRVKEKREFSKLKPLNE